MYQKLNTEQYLKEFDLQNPDNYEGKWRIIQDQKEDHNFKILKITVRTVEAAVSFMRQKPFYETYNQATHLFFIVIDVIAGGLELTTEYISTQLTYFNQRPHVIQWEARQLHEILIFYRQPNNSRFCLLDIGTQKLLIEEEFVSQENYHFSLILQALRSRLGGFFNGNLLDITLDVTRELDSWRLIDYVAKSNDSVLMRFLMLFSWNLTKKNKDGRKALEIAVEYSDPQTISALLDLPILLTSKTEKIPSAHQKRIGEVIDDTVLRIAMERGRSDTLNLLIECGVDVNYRMKSAMGQDITLIDIAWNKRRYDNMLVLLKADSSYPREYNLNSLKDTEANVLQKFTQEVGRFHQAIRQNDVDGVQHFIKSNPYLRKVHNQNNESALRIALEAQQYEVFALLQSKGFTPADNETLHAVYERLNDRQKNELKIAKLRYFKKHDNAHIIFLLSKSKIHSQNVDIEGLFEQLDNIAEMSTIMKVLESSESIEIVFLNKSQSSNLCDYTSGRLLVEVEQPTQTLYKLANELTRLALQNVYKNNAKPYTPTDRQNEFIFQNIIDKCHNRLTILDPIIQEVFNIHTITNWPSELIVRVPLALVHCGKEITEVKEHAPELFSFYENYVQKDFLNYIADPSRFKYEHKIKCLNGLLGELNVIQQSRLWLKEETLSTSDIFHAETVTVVVTNFPALVKSDLYQTLAYKTNLRNIQSRYIFATLTHFKNTGQIHEIFDLYQSVVKPTFIIDCTCDSIPTDIWVAIKDFREKERIILIAKKLSNQFRTAIINKLYKWHDLRIDTQSLLLQKPVDFQGYKITLNELVMAKMILIELFPLEILIEDEEIRIGEPLPVSYGFHESFYIARTFRSQLAIKDEIIADITDETIYYLAYTEAEFQKLCEKYPLGNVHWISKEETGQLIWQKSCGDITNLREHIDTENRRLFPPKSIGKLLEQARRQKTMIISDTAGMGKSTILTYLSKEIKRRFPTYWVVVLHLNNYTEELERQSATKIDTVEFLVDKLLRLSSSFEKALFTQLLSIGKVILMLDGFDEVCPLYEDIMVNLLIRLSASSIEQLWVTTRPHLQYDLQKQLNQLAYTLEPFSKEEQTDFLIRFWRRMLKLPEECDISRVKLYAEALLEKLLESINDDVKVFAGIPLQIRMVAEAFSQEFSDFYFAKKSTISGLPTKLDLLTVYERFLHNKYRIYVAEKSKPLNVTVATKDLVGILKGGINLRKLHQQMALEVLFPQQKEALLKTKKIHYLPHEQLNRIGIVQYVGPNRVNFIHQTFAEYYVADFFTSELATQLSNTVQVENFLLANILLQDKFQTIRAFFESLLTKKHTLPQSIFSSYGHSIEKLWKIDKLKYKNNTILYVAVQERNISIVTFLLNCLKMGRYVETLKDLLLYDGNYNKMNHWHGTVMHLAVSDGNLNMLDMLWLWAKEAQLNSKQIVRLLLAKDESSATLWHEVAKQGHSNVLEKLYKWTISALNSNYVKILLLHKDILRKTIWHYAISGGNFETLQKLRFVADELQLESSYSKEILLTTDLNGQNVWHYVADDGGSLYMLEKLGEWAIELQFDPSDLKKIFLNDDKKGRTVFHLAAISGNIMKVERIWKVGKQIPLDQQELKHLLFNKNSNGQTVFQEVAVKSHLGVLDKLWEWTKGVLSKGELKEVLFALDKKGANIWEITEESSPSVLEKLWTISKEIQLSEDDLKKMLLDTNNPWQLAAKTGQAEIMKNIWGYLKQVSFSKTDLEQIILKQNLKKKNSLQLAAENGNVRVFCILLQFLEEILNLKEISDILMTNANQKKILWHHASIKEHVKVLNVILKWGNEKLTGEMLTDFFNAKTKYEESMLLVSKWQELSLEELFKWCKENLPIDTFKKIIFQKQLLGKYAWMQKWEGEKAIVDELLRWCKQNLTAAEICLLMRTRDYSSRTLFQVIMETCSELFFELWDFDKDVQTRADFKLLFLSYGLNTMYDGNILHYAMRHRNTKILTNIWRWGQRLRLSKQDIKMLMKEGNSHGLTFIHIIVSLNEVESTASILEETLNCAQAVLESQDFKEVLVRKSSQSQNVMHLMAYARQLKELFHLFHWCLRNLTKDDFKELMLDKYEYGEGATTLHILAKEDVRGWLDVLQWLKNNIESNLFNELFLAEDNQRRNSYKIAEEQISKSIIDNDTFEKFCCWSNNLEICHLSLCLPKPVGN